MGKKIQTYMAESQDWGLSFESHFPRGYEGIVARYEAPVLRFPASMPLQTVRDTMDVLNLLLQGAYRGAGYYAFCPMQEIEQGSDHVLILFGTEAFYQQFKGSFEADKALESLAPYVQGFSFHCA